MATKDPSRHGGPCRETSITLEHLLELHQRHAGVEVLVDAGAYMLAAGEQWSRVRKLNPSARFPITVDLAGHGPATYQLDEIRGFRERSHAPV